MTGFCTLPTAHYLTDMISRVAEHCFWLARYLERAENTARILEVNHTLLLDFQVPLEQQWLPLLIISGIHDYPKEPSAENVQEYMTWDEENPCSVVSSLRWARENGRIIREVISAETWERLNYYHLWMHSPKAREVYESNRSEFYGQIRRINQLIHGIADATMSHGEPWEFFRLGRYLERTSQTARILDVKYHMLLGSLEEVGSPVDHAHWVAILMSCSGYEPFHKKVLPANTDVGIAVVDFLFLDEEFPRSVRHCIGECRKACGTISGSLGKDPANDADRTIAELADWLSGSTIHSITKAGLHECLTHVVDSIHAIGAAVQKTYFNVEFQPPSDEPCSPDEPVMKQEQRQG